MQWRRLERMEQLEELDLLSQQGPVLIFKHSTRCIISSLVLDRLERATRSDHDLLRRPTFYLDLLKYRAISNAIADRYNVEHASPQVLVIRNGSCVYSDSHMAITVEALASEMH